MQKHCNGIGCKKGLLTHLIRDYENRDKFKVISRDFQIIL
jgi:hypothetical protein